MKEPHHQKKVGIGMIMVAASLGMIGILQVAIGPDVLFADDIQRQQVEVFENCKANDFQEPQCAKWLDEMQLQEVEKILGEDSDIFCIYYDVTDGGNFEGKTILANNINASSLGFKFGKSESEIQNIISKCSDKLLEIRNKREQPGKDDKIITSWNGLMISAFLSGYRITGNSKYLDVAKKSLDFFENNFEKNHILHRTFKNGEPKLNGYLDDYTNMANASLDMFEITSDIMYLLFATNLSNYLITHFWDDSTHGFFFTSDNHEKLIIRPKSNYDLSMPSGNQSRNHLIKN